MLYIVAKNTVLQILQSHLFVQVEFGPKHFRRFLCKHRLRPEHVNAFKQKRKVKLRDSKALFRELHVKPGSSTVLLSLHVIKGLF